MLLRCERLKPPMSQLGLKMRRTCIEHMSAGLPRYSQAVLTTKPMMERRVLQRFCCRHAKRRKQNGRGNQKHLTGRN
jgi:hypothetical protein